MLSDRPSSGRAFGGVPNCGRPEDQKRKRHSGSGDDTHKDRSLLSYEEIRCLIDATVVGIMVVLLLACVHTPKGAHRSRRLIPFVDTACYISNQILIMTGPEPNPMRLNLRWSHFRP
jgi:hypothetical protein